MIVLLFRPGAAPGPGGPPQPAQQSKRLQQTQAQVDEVLDISLETIIVILVDKTLRIKVIWQKAEFLWQVFFWLNH